MLDKNSILISNPARQHTPYIVFAFSRLGFQVLWLTSFWFFSCNIIYRAIFLIAPNLKKQFLKRSSKLISNNQVRFNFLFSFHFLFGRFLWKTEMFNFIQDILHDIWVSFCLKKFNQHVLVGYEKSCYFSFKVNKRRGGINILDLAHVHVLYTEKIRNKYLLYRKGTGSDILFKYIKRRKIREYELADYIFVLSKLAKESLIISGVDSSKIQVLNLGFDSNVFSSKSFYCHDKNSKLKIIFVGNLSFRKGVSLIFEVSDSLKNLNIEWVFIGTIDDKLPANQGNGNVNIISYLEHDKLSREFNSSDVFVFPSFLDSWGMAVVEAMACGLPVIISENTGSKDIVSQDCGFLIPVDDSLALKEKVLYFYYNRSEIERMGRNAALVAKNYTWDNYYSQVEKFIFSQNLKSV